MVDDFASRAQATDVHAAVGPQTEAGASAALPAAPDSTDRDGTAPGAPGAPGAWPQTVGDLVEAADVPSVVRLTDLADPTRRRMLGTAFLVDPVLHRWLSALAAAVAAGRGRPLLVEGPYGAGKSHLLAALAIWAAGEPLAGMPRPPRPALAVAPVSLIDHAAAEPLETTVRATLAAAAGRARRQAAEIACLPRPRAFSAIRSALRGRGLLILLDELSEYLRSKPSGPPLSEDVRFLQFLAEWAPAARAHVIASLNEPLAASLYLAPDLRTRLSDRFPARLALDRVHTADLITRRLRRLRPGARPWLLARHAELTRLFGRLPFSAEAFADLYPFHPQTVAWLHDLSGLLSARRGAVDFVLASLHGDPARGIAPVLAQPAGTLLCPDALCDHFADRLRENPATEALAAAVLPALAADVGALFADPEPRALAIRLGKLLALAAAAEPPRGMRPREIALALLHPLTDLGPAPNLEFVASVRARLAGAGAFVAAEAAATGEPAYRLDAQLDDGLRLQRRLATTRAQADRDGVGPWLRLAAWCVDPGLPLGRLQASGELTQEVPWRGARRVVRLIAAEGQPLSEALIRGLARDLDAGEADAAVLVVPPLPGAVERAHRDWTGPARRWLAAAAPRALLFCWLPRPAMPAEEAALGDASALAQLAADPGDLRDALAAILPDVQRRVAAIYHALYAEGAILGVDGPAAGAAPLPLAERLGSVLGAALARRFPRHPELRLPAAQGVFLHALRTLCREGRCDGGQSGAAAVAEAYLPFGLVARTADGGLRLHLDPQAAPVLGDVQVALRGATPGLPVSAADLYGRLRRGPYGLQRRAFEVLMLLVVGAGVADLCRGGRRLSSEKLVPAAVWEADGLAAGELLAPGPLGTLRALPWLPERLRAGHLSQATQREAWDAVRAWCGAQRQLAAECQARLADVGRLPSARTLAAAAASDLRRLQALVGAADQGLKAFLQAWDGQAEAASLVARCQDLRRFLAEGFDPYLWAAGYLEGAVGALPAEHPLRAEAVALAGRAASPLPAWTELLADCERFRDAYAAEYLRAHADAVGEAAVVPYRALRASHAAVVATTLSVLPATESPKPWSGVQRQLDGALASACRLGEADLAERLRRTPLCACGFRPAHPPRRPAIGDLTVDAEASARGYLASLSAPAAQQRLRAHATALRAVGRAEQAERMAAFLRRARLEPLPAAAAALAGEVGAAIREALEGQMVVVDRDPGELAERLRGRVLVPDGVLALVRAWVGEVPPGAFVRLGFPAAAATLPPLSPDEALAAVDAPGAATVVIHALWDGVADPASVLRVVGTSAAADACRAAAAVAGGLQALRQPPPADTRGWEMLWRGPAGRVELAVGRLHVAAAEAGLMPLPPLSAWAAECVQRLGELRPAFSRVAPGPGIEALWRRMASGSHLWWLDALREDLADELATAMHDVATVRERGFTWARVPTTTEAYLAALRAAGCELPVVTWTEGVECDDPSPVIVRWPFLDDRVHGSREPYGELAAGFADQCRHRLRPALAALRSGSEVWIFSDHGFVESPAARHGAPRYLHGGGSPEEVLAPWLRLVRR